MIQTILLKGKQQRTTFCGRFFKKSGSPLLGLLADEAADIGKTTRTTSTTYNYVGIELQWEGEAEHEKGICVSGPDHLVGKTLVEVSPDFYRPTDVVNLWGDPTKARAKLGWNPNTTTFEELVKIMVDHDMAKVASEGAAAKVRMNLAEYLEKGIVK